MVAELIAEESYGEESLRALYLISPETGELRKERLYENNSWTSFNKFIKVEYSNKQAVINPLITNCRGPSHNAPYFVI